MWRPVSPDPLTEKYEVSDTGLIRNTRFRRELKGKIDKDGYHRVSINIRGDGFKKEFLVHRLVALTFHGPPA